MAEFRAGQMQGSPLLQAVNISSQARASRRAEEMQVEQFKWMREDRVHNKLKQELAGKLQGAASNAGAGLWDYTNNQLNNSALANLPFTKQKKADMWQEYQQAAAAGGVSADADYFEAQWAKQKLLQDQNVTASLSSAKATSRLSEKEFNIAMRGGGETNRAFNDYMSGVHPEVAAGFTTATKYDPAYETFTEGFTGPKSATLGAVAVGTGVASAGYARLLKKRAPLQALLENLQSGKRFEKMEGFVRKQQGKIQTAGARQAELAKRASTLRTEAGVLTGDAQKKKLNSAKYYEGKAKGFGQTASTAQGKLDSFQTARQKQIVAAEKRVAATKPGARIGKALKGKPWLMRGGKALGYIGAPLITGPIGGAIGGAFGYEEGGAAVGRIGAYTALGAKGARKLAGKGVAKAVASKSPMLIKAGKLLMKGPSYSKGVGALLLSLGGALAFEGAAKAVTPKP